MKNSLFILISIMLAASCSSTDKQDEQAQRLTASYQPMCAIEKHPEQPVYRLKMYGKTYNRFWYTAKEVETLYNNFVMQGRCL